MGPIDCKTYVLFESSLNSEIAYVLFIANCKVLILVTCGEQATQFYNSTSYQDELVWGGTWLFFATGNTSYLGYATEIFFLAEKEELFSEKGIFYWNNKLTANVVILILINFWVD